MIDPDVPFTALLLRIIQWAEITARQVLENGRSLNEQEMDLARQAGIQHPEEVLLLVVPALPVPGEDELKQAARQLCLITPYCQGLAIGYSIFLREATISPAALAHQLLKVTQCERCEGIPTFLEKYTSEILTYGYPDAPMEQEAISFARQFKPSQKA